MFVLFEFLDSLLYVHLFIAPEGYDEGILEFCQDLFSRTVDLVVVSRGTIGVFVQSAFHIIFDLSKSFQEQFEHNQRQLLAFLQEQLAQNGGSI